MTNSTIVCFRASESFVTPAAHLATVRAITEQAAARGARLLAWGAAATAFELDSDAIQDVIELALSVIRDAPEGTEPSVGISEGPLERVLEATAHIELAWGPALVRATLLARAARPGEVLVDPLLASVKRGDLSTAGSRVGIHGKERVRGLLLDVAHPFRTALASGARGLARAKLVGRPELGAVDVPGGTLAIVRAGRGHGGTRFLEELEQQFEPARVLDVSPHPFGEPLGALRRALLRAVTMGHAPLNLTGHAGVGLDALLAGEGLDPDSSAELLAMWLTPDSVHDARGVVLLDDASEIDADTLEVVARASAASGEPFRIVARLSESEALPVSLSSVPRASEITLGPLSHDDAVRLAVSCTRGDLDETSAARWADRGGRLPLGIVETIRQSIESGEIVWEEGHTIARLRPASPVGPGTPKHWVKRRLDEQAPDGRIVLEALSVLGGQAESLDLSDLLRRKVEVRFDFSAPLAVLQAAGWVLRLKPDVVSLPGATHRDAVLASFSDAEFQAWHRAASECFQDRDRPLAMAPATIHAILAGESERARALSRRAAAAIRAVGLALTADAFDQFAARADVAALAERNLFTSQLEMARAVPSIWPEVRISPPPKPFVVVADPPTSPVSIGGVPRRSMPPPLPIRGKRKPVALPPDPPASVVRPSLRAPPGAEGPPSAAVEALRKGDLEAVERMAARIGVDEARIGLSERLQAMAKLARGETGDAIRRLRDAAGETRRTGSRDRCRAALALAVALAATGRHEEALIEGLDALGRARELADERGEHACLRFLSQLAMMAGHHDVAEAWVTPAGG